VADAIEVRETPEYAAWLRSLRDERARARITARVRRLSLGNYGDAKSIGGGLSELRVDYGPGYRVYLIQRGSRLVILLAGGDKTRQTADIARARELATRWEAD
jgi:putative addiction module killer protein